MLERERNRVQDPGAHLREREDDEQETLQEHGRQGELPGVAHREAHREHEEGVQAHARGEGERLLGIERHHERTDEGREGGGGEDRALGHVEGAEDARVDGQDVGHRQERGDARDNLCPDIVLLGVKAESLSQELAHMSAIRRPTWCRCKASH